MKREGGHADVADLTLERFALGELPEAERAELEERIGSEAALRERLESLRQSDRELREEYPAEVLARGVRARLAQSQAQPERRAPAFWPLPAALAAAALLAVTIVPRILDPGATETQFTETVRFKGTGASLTLHRKTAAGSEVLGDGALALEGDLIRLAYRAPDGGFGVILSVDGRGSVTRHLPQRGERAVALESGRKVLLDFAYELDDAPRWERFYFVTGAEGFAVGPVLAAARALDAESGSQQAASLDLPNGLEQYVVSLKKKKKGVAQ
jgi:hypothetical protein